MNPDVVTRSGGATGRQDPSAFVQDGVDPNQGSAVHRNVSSKTATFRATKAKKPAIGEARPVGAKRLRRAAQSTMLVAGLVAARLTLEAGATEPRLFSPGLVDRLRSPITRFHE